MHNDMTLPFLSFILLLSFECPSYMIISKGNSLNDLDLPFSRSSSGFWWFGICRSCLMQTSVSGLWLKPNMMVKETAKRGRGHFITNQSKFTECEHKLAVCFFLEGRGALECGEESSRNTTNTGNLQTCIISLFSLTYAEKRIMIWRRSENRKCSNEFAKTAWKTCTSSLYRHVWASCSGILFLLNWHWAFYGASQP